MRPSRRDLLLLTAGCAVLYGLRLGARDLWNPNEPIYGEAVREMAERADWLVPHVNGLVFAEKPILFFWLALLASKVMGGVSEASLRVPSFLAGVATVLGAYVLALPYAGRARAFASSVAVATMFGVFWNARCVQMDILVTAATLWVIVAVTRVVDHDAPPLRGFVLAGAVAGFGFLAKGPVAWICPGLTIVVYLLATRRLYAIVRWETCAGIATCVGVAAPWFVMLALSGHSAVISEVLFRQNLARFVNPWDHQAPFWYYLESCWVDMGPWALFVPLAIGLPRRDEGERRLALLSSIWVIAVIVFFSLSKSKRSPYILPIAPAVAILAAEVALSFTAGRLRGARNALFVGLTLILSVGFVGAGVVVFVGASTRLDEPTASAVAFLGLVASFVGAWVLFDLSRKRKRAGAAVSLAAAAAAIYLAAAAVTLPALDVYKSARHFCADVSRLVRPGDEVASYAFWNWRAEYRYYLRMPITNLLGAEPLREAWNGTRRVVLLVEAERIADARQVIGDASPAIEGRVGGGSVYVFTNR